MVAKVSCQSMGRMVLSHGRSNQYDNELIKKRMVLFFSLSSAHFTNDLYHGFLPVLLPLIVSRFHMSLTLVGFLMSLWTLTAGFSQLLSGYLSDRFKGIHFVASGLVLSSVGTAIFYCPKYEWLIFLVILGGLGTALFHPQAYSLVGNSIPPKRKNLGISTFSSVGSLGYATGPIFAAMMMTAQKGQYFYLGVIPALVVVLLLLFSFDSTFLFCSAKKRAKRAWKYRNFNLWKLNFRSISLIWLVMVIRTLVTLSVIIFLPILWKERGISTMLRGEMLSLWLLLGAIGTILGGYASDRFGKKKTIVSSLVLAIPLTFFFVRGSGIFCLVFLIGSGITLFTSGPLILVMGHELAPRDTAMVSGLIMGLAPAVSGLCIPIAGLLADIVGITIALEIIIICLAGTIPLILMAFRQPNLITLPKKEKSS